MKKLNNYFLVGFIAIFIGIGTLNAQNEIPDIIKWLDDQYYLENRINDEGEEQVWKVNAENGKSKIYQKKKISDKVNEALPEGFALSRSTISTDDYNNNIFIKDNDLYWYSRDNDVFKRLTDNTDEEQNPTFSPDETKIAFTRNNDLYVIDLETGVETRLTHDGTDLIKNGYSSWVYWEEIHGRGSRYKTFWWSPDGSMIAYERFDDEPVPEFFLFNPDGIHGNVEMQRYPKVGDPNPWVKLGVIALDTKETTWIDSNDEEDVYIAFPMWAQDSKTLYYQRLNRDQDHMLIMAANPNTGEKKMVYEEVQDTWIDFFADLYILENGSGFIVRSDKDGWRNLYYFDTEGNQIAQLTDVDWRVQDIEMVDEENGVVFFTGTGDSSINSQLFRVNLDGTGFEKITSQSGTHNPMISENGSYVIDTYSSFYVPRKMQLVSGNGRFIKLLGANEPPDPDAPNNCKVEYFTIPTKDGFELPAYWKLPPDFDPDKKYGVLFSIYGAPNFQDVSNRYINTRENFLSQNDIILFAVDHRGSIHFGERGKEYIYKNMGKWDLDDYITSVKWLKEHPFIDSTKVGIWGGSYGGYMAALALTRGADYFTCGIASAAATDFRLYDNIYTERYMGTYEDNPEGYDYASVMTHADMLKGNLFILHGTMDDNVHFQHVLQLIDKLTDLNKDFDLMIYPKGRHGWGAPKYSHSFRESREYVIDNLGSGEE